MTQSSQKPSRQLTQDPAESSALHNREGDNTRLPDQAHRQGDETDATPTTTRDTTETNAYAHGLPSAEGDHADNQTTDDSLRAKRSRNR